MVSGITIMERELSPLFSSELIFVFNYISKTTSEVFKKNLLNGLM